MGNLPAQGSLNHPRQILKVKSSICFRRRLPTINSMWRRLNNSIIPNSHLRAEEKIHPEAIENSNLKADHRRREMASRVYPK
jgi:hypothetical protein